VPVTEFVFMRYAEATSNLLEQVTSAAPGCGLSERGVDQACDAAGNVALRPGDLVAVSPLRRAQETADLVVAGTGHTPVVDVRLREFAVGTLEGRTDRQARDQLWSAWPRWLDQGDLDYRPAEGSESGREAVDRFADFVQDWSGHGAERVLVVSHGTLLQLALTVLCTNIATLDSTDRWISNTRMVRSTYDGTTLISDLWDAVSPSPVTVPDV